MWCMIVFPLRIIALTPKFAARFQRGEQQNFVDVIQNFLRIIVEKMPKEEGGSLYWSIVQP